MSELYQIMTMLTTRQRDLLLLLLVSDAPMATAELAEEMQLTTRQVSYDLKGARRWLEAEGVVLQNLQGVGVAVSVSESQQAQLVYKLNHSPNVQLVLTAGQRQQLLVLILLTADEPKILYQLQQLLQMSRTTVLKDLDVVTAWLGAQGIPLERRPNYGFWVECSELIRREAIAALLWGDAPFGEPLVEMNHKRGLVFPLGADAALMSRWDMRRAAGQVAYVEAQLGGRFTDDAVLYLSLVLAIQAQRVQAGAMTAVSELQLAWLKTLPVWPVAKRIAKPIGHALPNGWPEAETAYIAMHILSTPRHERWPGDLEIESSFSAVIAPLINHVVAAYGLPNLEQDKTLRDGLVNHVVPACFRHRFNLWLPPFSQTTMLSQKYVFEYTLAQELADIVNKTVAVQLPKDEVNNIALLLRAAYIRERPNRLQRVLIVCPSGMASAQLLTARLTARFPRLGNLEVLSLREISQASVDKAELIISTVPLPESVYSPGKMIQVHPLLLPEDIETITQWLA